MSLPHQFFDVLIDITTKRPVVIWHKLIVVGRDIIRAFLSNQERYLLQLYRGNRVTLCRDNDTQQDVFSLRFITHYAFPSSKLICDCNTNCAKQGSG